MNDESEEGEGMNDESKDNLNRPRPSAYTHIHNMNWWMVAVQACSKKARRLSNIIVPRKVLPMGYGNLLTSRLPVYNHNHIVTDMDNMTVSLTPVALQGCI